MPPFLRVCVLLLSPLGVVEYLHGRMLKKKAPVISFPIAVLRWDCFFLQMWNTSLSGVAFWCFVGGLPDLYPHSFCCRIKDLCHDAYRVEFPRRCVQKDSDTSNMTALTVLWSCLGIFFATN